MERALYASGEMGGFPVGVRDRRLAGFDRRRATDVLPSRSISVRSEGNYFAVESSRSATDLPLLVTSILITDDYQ